MVGLWCSCQLCGKNVTKLAKAPAHRHDCFHIAPSAKKKSPKGSIHIFNLRHVFYIHILRGAHKNITDSALMLVGLCSQLLCLISHMF